MIGISNAKSNATANKGGFDGEGSSDKRFSTDVFWGRLVDFDMRERVATLAFVAAAIVAVSFNQIGFWSIGVIDSKPVYLMLILAPLAMGALLFGPVTGALLGLLSGVVVFAHAELLPLDFYEVYFMTPQNTFVLLTVLGGLSGLFFSRLLGKVTDGAARFGCIAAVCLVTSVAASVLVAVNTIITYGGLENLEEVREYLLNSPAGMVVQAAIDAVAMFLFCIVAEMFMRKTNKVSSDRKLLNVFRYWMFAVSSIVFMLTCSFIFSMATLRAQDNAYEQMLGEARYIKTHIESGNESNPYELLDGYDPALDGTVIISDKQGIILATDNENEYPKGGSFVKLLGYGRYGDGPTEFFNSVMSEEDMAIIQAPGEKGMLDMSFIYMLVDEFDDGYIIMMYDSDMVYATRFGVMASSTFLAILLIASIAAVATVLLNRVVVRHIAETNGSLEKITDGNLNERVSVRDSREFASLSAGINTTVDALKDSIAEAEQRNAQELLTAKAIQESALPRDFPPFPDIDRFDIYASMKTAKEVGGDFYDFFILDEGKLGFIIADVSGKGIPAALFMMTSKTQIRTYMDSGLPIDEAVSAANHQLCLGNDAGMFVTMIAGVLDYDTGDLQYVNAGHNPPLLLHGGAWEWMRKVSGMPLGLFDGIPYKLCTCQLEPADMVYLYTDGVTEAMDIDGNLFGEQRLEETLYKYSNMNSRSVAVGVRRAITDFTLDAEQSDDITILALKYGVPPEKKAVMILRAEVEQLVHVCNFIHEELHRRGAPKWVSNPLDIAAEELFVNVCHYAYPGATPEDPGEVRIGFEYEANPPSLTVTIEDDGIPYNPLAKPDAVTPDNIADVPIGGLGILMAKRSVDSMEYERRGESNVLTFRKGW